MRKKFPFLAVTALVTATTTTMVPAVAQAGGAEMLRKCLESIEGAPNHEQARSMCMWKHYDYMASYGR